MYCRYSLPVAEYLQIENNWYSIECIRVVRTRLLENRQLRRSTKMLVYSTMILLTWT